MKQAEQEKVAAIRDRDQARADCNAAKAELTGLQSSLDTYKALVENLNTQLKQVAVGHTDLAKALEDWPNPHSSLSSGAAQTWMKTPHYAI